MYEVTCARWRRLIGGWDASTNNRTDIKDITESQDICDIISVQVHLGVGMKIYAVWNEKGGVGKSAIAYFLASGLSEAGLKVLLLDADRG